MLVWETYTCVYYITDIYLFLQISRTIGTDTSTLRVVIGTQYVYQYYHVYVASSPDSHAFIACSK